ncbi:zinc ribbon domain-containing protein [Alkalinema pantanalense CENA528]|uniref:zinc ribbon domain-containing protein n=1 Tax=Alkalinema pantanalense TaxID=1620705 RepID=UPI003D6F269E
MNPNGTSQDCSNCGHKINKQLFDRWHACPNGGCSLDHGQNAAINITHRAVGHSVLNAQGTSEAIAGVIEKPALYASA